MLSKFQIIVGFQSITKCFHGYHRFSVWIQLGVHQKVKLILFLQAEIINLYSYFILVKEWSQKKWNSCVFSMQGKRDNNEDRAVIETVEMVEGVGQSDTVDIWAVMDGHGGQV